MVEFKGNHLRPVLGVIQSGELLLELLDAALGGAGEALSGGELKKRNNNQY